MMPVLQVNSLINACYFTEFMEQALIQVHELQQGVQDVKAAAANVARHFCEDPEKFQLEECFKLFSDFFRRVEEVHKVRN
jgi:predicted hydrolase (HD superfamily)